MLLGTTAIIGYANAPQYIDSKGGNGIVCLENDVPADIPTKENIKMALADAVNKYGLDPKELSIIDSVIMGESSYNPNANNGISVGLAQFTLDTWLGNCGFIDERKDYEKSLDCMVKLWAKGEKWRWDIYCLNYYDEKCIIKRGLYPKK